LNSAEYRFRLPIIGSVLHKGEPSLTICPKNGDHLTLPGRIEAPKHGVAIRATRRQIGGQHRRFHGRLQVSSLTAFESCLLR